MGRILRGCAECGAPFQPRHAGHRHCPRHEKHGRAHRSPTTQAQDAEYRAERARILVPGALCHWCGAPATTTDHVISVAKGGRHVGNLVPSCKPCNDSKQDRDPGEWAASRSSQDGAGEAPVAPRPAPSPGRPRARIRRLV